LGVLYVGYHDVVSFPSFVRNMFCETMLFPCGDNYCWWWWWWFFWWL